MVKKAFVPTRKFFTTLREKGIMTLGELSISSFFERMDNFETEIAETIFINMIEGFKRSLNLSQYNGQLSPPVYKRLAKTPVYTLFPVIDKQKCKKNNIKTLKDMVLGWFDSKIRLINGLKLTDNLAVLIKLNSIIISDLQLLDFYPLPEFGE